MKPSNVIFVGGVPKLADIGLVAAVSDSRSFVGTEGYIPPEGPGAPSADCYALGKLLYELSTGHDRTAWPEPPADLPARPDRERLLELNAILHKACAAEARRRYKSAEEMLAELDVLERGESVKRKHAAKRLFRAAVMSGAVVTVMAVAAFAGHAMLKALMTEGPFSKPGSSTAFLNERGGTTNQHAKAAYDQAWQHLSKANREGSGESFKYFQQAIELDPNYALAYVSVADAYVGACRWYLPASHAIPEARRAVARALEIDDGLAQAHVTLARIALRHDWDWPAAERELKRAMELNPKWHFAFDEYALLLRTVGRIEDARSYQEKALALAPTSTDLMFYLGEQYCIEHQYESAAQQVLKALSRLTNHIYGLRLLAEVLSQQGRWDEALSAVQTARALKDAPDLIALQGYIRAVMGRQGEATEIAGELERLSQATHVSPYFMALVKAGLRDKERAMDLLERAYEQRAPALIVINSRPPWNVFRSDPRFLALLRKMGFQR